VTEQYADPWPAPRAAEPVRATLGMPGSKSLTNRAVLLAALADAPSVVRRALRSRDTELMAAALGALGARVDSRGADWSVTPGWPADLGGGAEVDCGLAGTVMRFVPPVAALADGAVRFDGDPEARARPMGDLLAGLRRLGVEIDDGGRGRLPFTVLGRGSAPGGTVVIDASASSQFVSALLLAGARYDAGVDVTHDGKPLPSAPHIEMTVACLRQHGVEVNDTDASRWRVFPGPVHAVDVCVEPDLSNAAPFLAAALVTAGSVTVENWPARTAQAGDRFREIAVLMGGAAELGEHGLTVTGSGRLRGLDVDLHDAGELTPVVAALCALADSPSHLRGVAHIRGHETDRLAALGTELSRLGADVTETADGLRIGPARLRGGVVATYGDHRIAHAAAVLGLAVDGVRVQNVATTAKTFPGFPDAWRRLVTGAPGPGR
jgi:3-phosphoshikimate 1-carboxyvinyltransferase